MAVTQPTVRSLMFIDLLCPSDWRFAAPSLSETFAISSDFSDAAIRSPKIIPSLITDSLITDIETDSIVKGISRIA
jgi:hypothetical protein